MNYGHPRNWIPVLKHWPELRLCLAGFGGNREWQHKKMSDWIVAGNSDENLEKDNKNTALPTREWIRCIIKLTKYKNVYADLSGLNIADPTVRFYVLKMLDFIKSGHGEFKHLKYKLILGSDGDLKHLIYNMNYNDDCREFKELFDYVDDSGKLWERVSLINAWNFYGLSEQKINVIYEELAKNASGNVDCNMLNRMGIVFNGSDEVEGIVKYISDHCKTDLPSELMIIDMDVDLKAMPNSSIAGLLEDIARKIHHEFTGRDLANKIMQESSGKPHATNPSSSAIGLGQWLRGTFAGMKKSGVNICGMQDVNTTSDNNYHETFKRAFPTVESQIPLFEAYFRGTTAQRKQAYEKVKGTNSIVDLINAEHFLGNRPLEEIIKRGVSDVGNVRLTDLESKKNNNWKTVRDYLNYAAKVAKRRSSDVDAFMKGE
jgi:hypothetical protein